MSAVLIVDDSLTVRMDLDEAFRSSGFEPTTCADVESARRLLATRSFSLMVLDVLLPDGDGLELLSEIKGSPRHAETPIMLLSTEADVRDRLRGLRAGADEYVGKPYDRATLVSRARVMLRQRQGSAAPRAEPGIVLVVDDSLTTREGLRSEFEQTGLTVVTAGSGEEGLRVAAERLPRAIVVDAVMPGMDGASFLRQLRGDPALHTTPCILLTSSGALGELPALEAGADAYLRKEEGHAVVLARLHALLRNANPAPAIGNGEMSRPPTRLLVVSAGEAALRDLMTPLREDGHDIVVATSAGEASELLALRLIDAMVLDGVADVPFALDACRRIKSDPFRCEVPLLLIADRSDEELMVDAINAGADDYFSLSSGPEVLRARVRAQLRRKRYEEENRAREGYVRSAEILESLSDGFFAVDREWRFIYVNRAFEGIVGASRASLVGQALWDRCHWLAAEPFQQDLRRAATAQEPLTFEAPGPGDRWFEVRALARRDGVSGYLRDTTPRRRAEEVQRHLLGIVSHDLRTPLTAVSLSTQMVLRATDLPEQHRRLLERAAGGAARMARLIKDLLDYSHARLGEGLPLVRRPSDLEAICHDAIEEVQAAHPGRAIEYRCEGDKTGDWDPDRIQQVLTNLLTNALRHGADSAAVTLSWRGDPDEKIISVHNDGPPIDPSLLERIFEPFQRGERKPEGVGLGLFIVREIVHAHGGRVDLRSEEGAGTTFTITLPSGGPQRSRGG
jgi:PAS domain S-box-containing protein